MIKSTLALLVLSIGVLAGLYTRSQASDSLIQVCVLVDYTSGSDVTVESRCSDAADSMTLSEDERYSEGLDFQISALLRAKVIQALLNKGYELKTETTLTKQ